MSVYMKLAKHWANQIQNKLRGDIDRTAEFHYLTMVVSEIQEDARKELGEAKAQLEGVARVMEALQTENLRIRKIAAHVPPKLWLEAEYAAGQARQIKAHNWRDKERKLGIHE